LYNGTAAYPDEATLRLSDSFEETLSLGIAAGESPALELVVKVLNINEGRNARLAGRCGVLAGYSAFVAKVREYGKSGEGKEESIKKAVLYCLEHDILKDYLEAHAAEVLNMLMAEWNLDDAKQVWYEEGREQGIEQGIERGIERGIEQGIEQGIERGIENTARNALAKGIPFEIVQEITGLDIEAVKSLQVLMTSP
jgi:hypothetical protein